MSISGFYEFLPSEMLWLEKKLCEVKRIFELYGFNPMLLPAVEKKQTLISNGDAHEIYMLGRLNGDMTDLGLRFDLTVPFARYVSENRDNLIFPLKRYQIEPVWRGERAQKGRYRQFIQCDVDILSNADLPFVCDAEIISVLYAAVSCLRDDFMLFINHRKILHGLLRSFMAEELIADAMRIIDKCDKLPIDTVKSQLQAAGVMSADDVCEVIFAPECADLEYISRMQVNDEFAEGVRELQDVMCWLRKFSQQEMQIVLKPSLARGLAYYTGTVFEGLLRDARDLGSVCGGGRYENLTQNFSKVRMPGVGGSIGISRIMAAVRQSFIDSGASSRIAVADVAVLPYSSECVESCIHISQKLRASDIKTTMFLLEKSLGSQLNYVNKSGIPIAVIVGPDEIKSEAVVIRDMSAGEQKTCALQEAAGFIKQCLQRRISA